MQKTNVLFLWNIDIKLKIHLKKQLSKEKNIELIFPKTFSEKNLLKLAKDADIIIGWRPLKKLLEAADNLSLFINPGTGVKHHIETFRQINNIRKVILVNGHGHSYATGQHAVAMLLALMNKLIHHHELMKNGKWRTSDDKDISNATMQLRNKKVGLLGYGAINKNVHRFLSGFELDFHILKRSLDKKNVTKGKSQNLFFYEKKDLNKFLKAIDILIIAIPHTAETESLIGIKELKLLGKYSLLVNVARGIIIKEKDLFDALRKKIISGAAIDVWYNYNPEKDKHGKEYPYRFPFHKLSNILLSPHRAASPFDDVNRWDEVLENIKRYSKGRKDFLNVVDLKREY